MATLPSDEQCARRLLEAFRRFNKRAGDYLAPGSFSKDFDGGGFRISDARRGVKYASEKKWVEVRSTPVQGAVFLTQLGFDEMPQSAIESD